MFHEKLLLIMHTILVPIDFSEAAYSAFQYGVHLANLVYARLKLIHVTPVPVTESYGIAPSPTTTYKETLAEKTRLMDEWERKIPIQLRRNIEILPQVVFGNVEEELIKHMKSSPPSLLVMGTKKRSMLSNFLFGGIIRELLPDLTCPLLIVPCGTKYKTINHISFGTNFQDQDHLVVERLMDFPFLTEATIHCVHVGNGGSAAKEDFSNGLEKLKEKFNRDVMFHTLAVEEPNKKMVVQELLSFSQEHKIQMMALLAHSRGFWGKLFQDSVVNKMQQDASIPLLVFNVEQKERFASFP